MTGAAILNDPVASVRLHVGQDEATSVVYGMPRAAHELGAVERQLPLGRIGPAILELVSAASPAASQPSEVQ